MGAGFTGKVAKALVNYITYSCADAVAKLKPDAAIFECEAGLLGERRNIVAVLIFFYLFFRLYLCFFFFFQR